MVPDLTVGAARVRGGLKVVLTFSAIQCAGEGAGAPGQRPVHIPPQFLLCSRFSSTPVLPETATLLRALACLPCRLRLHIWLVKTN